jgi:hypothetical protein
LIWPTQFMLNAFSRIFFVAINFTGLED